MRAVLKFLNVSPRERGVLLFQLPQRNEETNDQWVGEELTGLGVSSV